VQRARKPRASSSSFLPEAKMPLYKRIKGLVDKTYGIQTVCCVDSKLAKVTDRDQYIFNVALEFNLEFGSIN
jgi:eukaryotic translation initiation factor 2C